MDQTTDQPTGALSPEPSRIAHRTLQIRSHRATASTITASAESGDRGGSRTIIDVVLVHAWLRNEKR